MDRKAFITPAGEFHPLLCWLWIGDLTKEQIAEQIAEMKKEGFHEFLIYPGFGMMVPYLSDAYFELVGHAVGRAAAEGMKVWLYDEYNWPSGVAAGRVIREHPEYRMVYLRHFQRDIASGADDRQMTFGLAEGESLVRAEAFCQDGRRIPLGRECLNGSTLSSGSPPAANGRSSALSGRHAVKNLNSPSANPGSSPWRATWTP